MRTIGVFAKFVELIKKDNSRKYKQEILTRFKDDQTIRYFLDFVFNPFVITGISTKKFERALTMQTPGVVSVHQLMEYLRQNNTGRDEDLLVVKSALNGLPDTYKDLLKDVITKRLVLGIDAKSINAVIPNFLPTFNVQLANRYFDAMEKVEGKSFAITEKIDGGRIIAIKEHGCVEFYTRAGQRYEGLVDLEEEMNRLMPEDTCLDGEITILNNKGVPSKEAYKRAMKITRSDGPKTGLKMLVFDCMTAAEFKSQTCKHDYITRRANADWLFSTREFKFFELLPILYVGKDTSKITELLDEMVARGSEGIMVNLCNAKYEFKRTNALLKCKKFLDADLEIIGFEEGTGRLAGTLGAVLVRYKDGNVVKVGSGFSDEMRAEIWANTSKFLNTICTVKYFEETTNKDGGISLRFPTFISIRTDKLEPDF